MATTRLNDFVRRVARERRVILLGGMAVIAHGYSRATLDVDVWLEPMGDSLAWADWLWKQARALDLGFVKLPHWSPVRTLEELAEAAEEIGMVRCVGLECPLDFFRYPNEMEPEMFDDVWTRVSINEDGTGLPDAVDLLLTKEETGRDKDVGDHYFLEGKIREVFAPRLRVAGIEEAGEMLTRYADAVVCEAALGNADERVRGLARNILREMAAAGDPASEDVLRRDAGSV